MSNDSNAHTSKYPGPDELCVDALRPLTPAKPCTLPIVAVLPDRTVASEKTGQILTFDDYCETVRWMPRHLVVTFSSDSWLWLLNDRWSGHRLWTWQVMVQDKPNRSLRAHVSYYGFRHPKGKSKREPFTNLVLDAGSFTQDIDTDLIELGQWVRDFCNRYGLRVRASAAGIAGQLLRHPMFYPEARRIVPKFINDKAREKLPGPFYERYTDARQQIEAAMYIDQEAAYHYAALTTPLPNANSIQASGHTHATHETDSTPARSRYARAGGQLFERELRKHGLAYVEVYVPPCNPHEEKYRPRCLRQCGHRHVWVWTNEIPYLQSLGMRILSLTSIWGTEEVDEGIPRYAEWARTLSREHPHMKGLLLMPYGALGRRPSTIQIHTPSGKGDGELLLAGRWLTGTNVRKVNAQTFTSNALQLGLIQAHVRALSLDMARKLSKRGEEVISIYSDGIFVRLEDNQQIPMFAPWRLKEDCLHLELTDSPRVPVRAQVRRAYMSAKEREVV